MVEPLTCEQAGSIGIGMTCSSCLLEQPSITSNCHEKKESVSLEEQQNWVKVESMSWLKSGAEYDDVFISHLEITPNFSENLERNL
jgi:hypothetical protein